MLQFASGQITTIAQSADLQFYGSSAFLADSGSTTSNSALTGLAAINGGLTLQAGTAIATNGAVTIGSNGSVSVDGGFEGIAGSSFTVNNGNGTLTVDGSLSIGRSAMTGIGKVKAGAISSTGTITLDGARLQRPGPAPGQQCGRLRHHRCPHRQRACAGFQLAAIRERGDHDDRRIREPAIFRQ